MDTRPSREWDEWLADKTSRHGDRMDLSDIPAKFLPFFRTGQRVKVRFGNVGEHELTGRIGITTGMKPALLLMRRSSDSGSSWLLHESDELVAVQRGRQYVEVTP